MARYTVNADYMLFRSYDGSPVEYVDCTDTSTGFFVDTRDALSEPSVEDLLPAGLSLWPRGAAWGTPDNVAAETDTVLAGFTRVLLSGFAELYARLWGLTNESRAGTLVQSLEDWERDYGLPEPCVTAIQTEAVRLNSLRTKIASDGLISPADFVRLAAALGYVIAIEEPEAFRVGESSVGGNHWVTSVALEQQFAVIVLDVPFSRFHVSEGQVGITPLLDFAIDDLQCAFYRAAPAWTYPVFNVAGWPLPYLLMAEDGSVIVTETGDALIAPALPSA